MNEINFYLRHEIYGFLSNFARYPQVIDEIVYPTNEHYYQSQKAKDEEVQKWIVSAPSPYLAMCAGRSLRKEKELKDNWNDIKNDVMLIGLRAKFSQNVDIKEKLLKTGTTILHEDNPKDAFWGKDGKDMLGKLLMELRKELQQQEE